MTTSRNRTYFTQQHFWKHATRLMPQLFLAELAAQGITIHPKAQQVYTEPVFHAFRHAGLICVVQRVDWLGILCGYVAVRKGHPLYGKEYSESIIVEDMDEIEFNGNYVDLFFAAHDEMTALNAVRLSTFFQVHYGINYSDNHLHGVPGEIGELWWFGFDCGHSGDITPFQYDFQRRLTDTGLFNDDQYRDFDYVMEQTKGLAEQLIKFSKQ